MIHGGRRWEEGDAGFDRNEIVETQKSSDFQTRLANKPPNAAVLAAPTTAVEEAKCGVRDACAVNTCVDGDVLARAFS